ncbi:hypothetical protein ACFYPX_29190 [Micromonospora zamorensis]|uniref:hypothetical protein n=1 Tax=Micromonospora zamorensis TaxID=709883 RepID=UPI0036B01ADC
MGVVGGWRDEQFVEALVPSPLPVASPAPALPAPAARTGDDGVLFDVSRPDASGRVTARALRGRLGR